MLLHLNVQILIILLTLILSLFLYACLLTHANNANRDFDPCKFLRLYIKMYSVPWQWGWWGSGAGAGGGVGKPVYPQPHHHCLQWGGGGGGGGGVGGWGCWGSLSDIIQINVNTSQCTSSISRCIITSDKYIPTHKTVVTLTLSDGLYNM